MGVIERLSPSAPWKIDKRFVYHYQSISASCASENKKIVPSDEMRTPWDISVFVSIWFRKRNEGQCAYIQGEVSFVARTIGNTNKFRRNLKLLPTLVLNESLYVLDRSSDILTSIILDSFHLGDFRVEVHSD
jgi:hypothetical protein